MSRESFDKWYQSIDKSLPVKNKELYWSYIGWQACAEEKDKRIAELEAENKRLHTGDNLKALLDDDTNALMQSCLEIANTCEEHIKTIAELTAQNKELVEALDTLVNRIKLFDNPSDGGLSQHDNSVTNAESLLAKKGE